MSQDDIWDLVRNYLALVDGEGAATTRDEQALSDVLDRLAAALIGVDQPDIEHDIDAPDLEEWNALYARVGRRFPEHGYYVSSALFEENGEMPRLAGDAIDDIADIARDLSRSLWLHDNHGPLEGLDELVESYWIHWRGHMRELQAYLDHHRIQTRGLLPPGREIPPVD